MLSESKVRELWENPNFPGSYTGITTFYKELKEGFPQGEIPPRNTVQKILADIPAYQIHAQYSGRQYLRHIDNVGGQGIAVQADLAFMPKYDGYTGFLLVVDDWNNFVYARPFKRKTGAIIFGLFRELFDSPELDRVTTIASDRGTEFTPNIKKFQQKGITWFHLRQEHKAFLSELYIRIAKARLYRALRLKLTKGMYILLT